MVRMGLATPTKLQVRYERSFIQDLKRLKPEAVAKIEPLAFGDWLTVNGLDLLPDLRALPGSNNIFYRFTWAEHVICIEMMGQILKFVRVLPKPPV